MSYCHAMATSNTEKHCTHITFDKHVTCLHIPMYVCMYIRTLLKRFTLQVALLQSPHDTIHRCHPQCIHIYIVSTHSWSMHAHLHCQYPDSKLTAFLTADLSSSSSISFDGMSSAMFPSFEDSGISSVRDGRGVT